MKKLFILLVSFILVLSACSKPIQYYDEELSEILATSLLERDRITKLCFKDIKEQDLECLAAESEVLKYDGKQFKNIHYQQYIDGLKKQVEALENYEFNSDDCLRLWNEGFVQRLENVFQLVEEEEIILPKEYRFTVVRELLKEQIKYNIIKDYARGSIQFEYEKLHDSFYVDISVENISNIVLKDVIVNISFDKKLHSFSKNIWEPGKKWNMRIFVSKPEMDYTRVVGAEFVKAKCFEDLIYDVSLDVKTNFE